MSFDYGNKKPDGQHERHPSLPESQLPKPDVPVRLTYKHLKCLATTRMPVDCARTYYVNPSYYSSTFCCTCSDYYPTNEFIWPEDGKSITEKYSP